MHLSGPDAGETPADAVTREVREEIDVEFIPTFYSKKIDIDSDPKNSWKVTYFTGKITGKIKLNPLEIEKVIFVSETDLENLNIAFDHKDRLKEFFKSKRAR